MRALARSIRRWLDTRPLVLCALFALLGLIAARRFAVSWPVWAALALSAGAALFALKKRALCLLLAFCVAGLWMTVRLIRPSVEAQNGVILSGVVDSAAREGENSLRVRLADVNVQGDRIPCKVMAYLYDFDETPKIGERLIAMVNTWTPSKKNNPGAYDYPAWLWRQRVALCATIQQKNVLDVRPAEGFSLTRWAQDRREAAALVIRRTWPEEMQPLVLALTLGDRSALPEETVRAYRSAGVAHLLAISGLHVSALLAFLNWILLRLGLGRKGALAIDTIALGAYALIVGLPASILRAGLMTLIAELTRLDGRPRDGLTALSASMLILLAVDPLYIEDAGFVLSCSAMGGLILLGRRWPEKSSAKAPSRLKSVQKTIYQAGRASLAAQLGALPATVNLFHQLPLFALPFNVVLVTLMTALFPLTLAVSALGALSSTLGGLAATPLTIVLRLFNWSTALTTRVSWATVTCGSWPPWLIALYAALLVALSPYTRFWRGRWAKRWVCAALAASVAVGFALPRLTAYRGLELRFLDVGQGDGAVVSAQGHVYLIDVGGDSAMADYLLDAGLKPEGIFLSHGHSDHAGGLKAILDNFPPCPLYVSTRWLASPLDEDVEAVWYEVMARGWPIVEVGAGDRFDLSRGISLTVLHPAQDSLETDQNANSMVCGIRYGLSEAIFTGDLPTLKEEDDLWLPRCDVLKVSHHGARASTSDALIQRLDPVAAVVSVGYNRYGHPSSDVLLRLTLSGAKVYRTDKLGCVTVRLDDERHISVSGYLAKAVPQPASP